MISVQYEADTRAKFDKVLTWLRETDIKPGVRIDKSGKTVFVFSSKQEAVMFKLTWGGTEC